jgi:3-methyladenine DNA glycosylase AlkD
MNCDEIITIIKKNGNPKNVEGMIRFGISSNNTYGVSMPFLRKFAKKIGKNHELSQQLWDSKIHEARILAALIDEPSKVTEKQMDSWVKDFDSWDVCDQVCMNLFDKTPYAWKKVKQWSRRKEEFVRRASFALMASLAFHDKKATDAYFEALFPLIIEQSTDERNFVKKAVNWALRQIGKRNLILNKSAIKTAKEIKKKYPASKSANWIANDALRELSDEKIVKRIKSKEKD